METITMQLSAEEQQAVHLLRKCSPEFRQMALQAIQASVQMSQQKASSGSLSDQTETATPLPTSSGDGK